MKNSRFSEFKFSKLQKGTIKLEGGFFYGSTVGSSALLVNNKENWFKILTEEYSQEISDDLKYGLVYFVIDVLDEEAQIYLTTSTHLVEDNYELFLIFFNAKLQIGLSTWKDFSYLFSTMLFNGVNLSRDGAFITLRDSSVSILDVDLTFSTSSERGGGGKRVIGKDAITSTYLSKSDDDCIGALVVRKTANFPKGTFGEYPVQVVSSNNGITSLEILDGSFEVVPTPSEKREEKEEKLPPPSEKQSPMSPAKGFTETLLSPVKQSLLSPTKCISLSENFRTKILMFLSAKKGSYSSDKFIIDKRDIISVISYSLSEKEGSETYLKNNSITTWVKRVKEIIPGTAVIQAGLNQSPMNIKDVSEDEKSLKIDCKINHTFSFAIIDQRRNADKKYENFTICINLISEN